MLDSAEDIRDSDDEAIRVHLLKAKERAEEKAKCGRSIFTCKRSRNET